MLWFTMTAETIQLKKAKSKSHVSPILIKPIEMSRT